jgi:hypothetical protein
VGDKIEKNEMGGACGTYEGRERCAQGVSGESRGKETIGESKKTGGFTFLKVVDPPKQSGVCG